MSLRLKLALLMGAFCLFMIGSVGSASWCIGFYLDATVSDFGRVSFLAGSLENMRDELRAGGRSAVTPEALGKWRGTLDDLALTGIEPRVIGSLRSTLDKLDEALLSESPSSRSEPSFDDTLLARLEGDVHTICGELAAQRKSAHDSAYAVQSIILAILTANIIVGCALVALAFLGVQRWITRPILRLHKAAEHFAAGRLDFRVPISSHDELGQLSTQVNAMAASLAETQRKLLEQEREAAFGEMAGAVAHNMRNPLASIRACAQSSIMHLTDDPQATEQCERIIDMVDHCERWIRNLLQVNRLVEITPEDISLPSLIHRVVDTSRPFAERKRVTLETNMRDVATGAVDSQLFEQALAVLIGNAVEASPQGQTVRVEARRESVPNKALVIDVIDQGPGVPSELRDKVFEAHFTTKPMGTGLGLHLARRIIRAHRGEVSIVDSHDGSGTCFRVRVPLNTNGKETEWPES